MNKQSFLFVHRMYQNALDSFRGRHVMADGFSLSCRPGEGLHASNASQLMPPPPGVVQLDPSFHYLTLSHPMKARKPTKGKSHG